VVVARRHLVSEIAFDSIDVAVVAVVSGCRAPRGSTRAARRAREEVIRERRAASEQHDEDRDRDRDPLHRSERTTATRLHGTTRVDVRDREPVRITVNGTWTFFHELSKSCAFGATTPPCDDDHPSGAAGEIVARLAIDAELASRLRRASVRGTCRCPGRSATTAPSACSATCRRAARSRAGARARDRSRHRTVSPRRCTWKNRSWSSSSSSARSRAPDLRVQVAAEEAAGDDDHHAPERRRHPRVEGAPSAAR